MQWAEPWVHTTDSDGCCGQDLTAEASEMYNWVFLAECGGVNDPNNSILEGIPLLR